MRIIDGLSKIQMGALLEIIYSNPDHGDDILLWAKKTRQKLVDVATDGDPRRIVFEKIK